VKVAQLVIGEFRGERGRRLAAPRRERPSRRRLLLQAAAVVVTVGLLAALGHWLLTSPTFAIGRIESGRYRYSDRASVDAALRRCLGRNIWTFSRYDLAAACSDLPWVSAVHVQRRLPDTVTVELTEWQPLLGVVDTTAAGGEKVLVASGLVLDIPAHLSTPGLPLLVGCRLASLGSGRWRMVDHDPGAVLALVAALEATAFESECPVDFVRNTPLGFEVTLQGKAGSLLIGTDDFAGRLARFLIAKDDITTGAAVDLRFEDRVTFEPLAPDSAETTVEKGPPS